MKAPIPTDMARLNRAEYCDAEQPAGGTKSSIVQLCRQYLLGKQTEEGAGSEHIANSAGLGFTGNSTCFIGSENLLRRSQLIGAPQPPFDEEYSKLFDANGYYKLNAERPETVLEAAIGQERSDPYAAVHEGNESSAHYDCPPENKKPVDCEKCKSSELGEASEQLPPVDDSTMREVKRGINWAYVNFSSMGEKELRRFLYKLAKICSATIRDFCPVPKMSIQLNSASPSDVENTLKAMHTLFTRMDGNAKGLLIVILPEDVSSDDKVKDVCENLGIIYHCCFPEHAMRPTKQYMKHTAYKILEEINKAVQYNTPFDSLEEIRQDEDEEEDDSEKDSHSDEFGEDETPISSDEEMEVVSFEEETGETEGSEQLEEKDDDRSEQLDSSDQQDIDGCDEDLPVSPPHPWVKRGNVSSWACINFSGMNEKETSRFLRKLRMTCVDIGMGFYPWPVMLRHGKSALPTDIEETVFGIHVELSALYANSAIEENQIGLLIVILPDKPESCDKVEEACESLGVAYQCCSSSDARRPSKRYLKDTAHKIEANVLRCDEDLYLPIVRTAIPFLSEAPTFVFGGAISPYSSTTCIASVMGLMDWPAANRYRSLFASQSHNDVIIKDLESLLSKHVHTFYKSTKKMPTRIIYFRNDVDEGQLSYTYEHERNVIRKVCPQAQITFVVVAQRPREFLGSESGEDCNLTKFSYINVDEGSNKLISYRVLHDDNHFTADKLNSLRISLCTPCIRWMYPQLLMAPPAYFAHLGASIAGDYLRRNEVSIGGDFPINIG